MTVYTKAVSKHRQAKISLLKISSETTAHAIVRNIQRHFNVWKVLLSMHYNFLFYRHYQSCWIVPGGRSHGVKSRKCSLNYWQQNPTVGLFTPFVLVPSQLHCTLYSPSPANNQSTTIIQLKHCCHLVSFLKSILFFEREGEGEGERGRGERSSGMERSHNNPSC